MTSIFGVYRLDDRPCEVGELMSMADTDAVTAWLDRSVGLATCCSTPLAAELLEHPASGCAIAGDVRLDNREDLVRALRLDGASRGSTDAEIALEAYLMWGESCLQWLEGDFAFGVWDRRNASLLCGRDRMGVRSLAYHYTPGRLFTFATGAAAVARCPGVPEALDEVRIGDYLLETLEGIDKTSTFFAAVSRLPPGHAIAVSRRGMRRWRYWAPEPVPILRLRSDSEYQEAFREVLAAAVASRTPTSVRAASMLSGGIDSGTIVALAPSRLAAESTLVTFSGVARRRGSDPETRAIYASLRMAGIEPHVVAADELDTTKLLGLAASAEDPFDGTMTLPRALYMAARDARATSLLDGAAGDLVLSPGRHLARMLRAGRLRTALAEARAEERFWSGRQPALRELRRAARAAFVPDPLLARLRPLRRRSGAVRAIGGSPISREFAERTRLLDRLEQLVRDEPPFSMKPAVERAAILDHPYLAAGRERYDRVARSLGVRAADPYLDHRVLALCLRLPDDQLSRNGWPKYIARNATGGHLADEVRWRRGREHLGWTFTAAVVRSSAARIAGSLEEGQDLLEPYVERSRISPLARDLASTDAKTQEVAYTLYCLAEWLRRHAGSRAASGGNPRCTAKIATRHTSRRS